MYVFRPMPTRAAAALAPLAALITGAAVLALPGLGHAQIKATVPAGPAKAVAALNGSAPAAAPQSAALQTVAPAPADGAAKPAIRRAAARPAARPAQAAPAAPAEPGVLHVDLSTAGTAARSLNLPFGKSAIVDLPEDVRDVLVTNPAVADAVLRSRRRISVLGIAPGDTDAVFFDDAGKRMLTLDIHVAKDSSGLSDAVSRLLPGSKVRIESVNDTLVLAGEVPTSIDADKVRLLAERFVAKPEQVVSLLSITEREQVMIRVRVVEMQRNIIKQLGFNTNGLWQQITPRNVYGALLQSSPTYGINQKLMGGGTGALFYGEPNISSPTSAASAMIQAFERTGLVRTLAEPNLTAVSGETAKFLAGGEYPIPVAGDITGAVKIEFKPFGVGLNFTPVVLSEGRISLKIATEVSEISSDNAFLLNSLGTATPSSGSSGSSSNSNTSSTPGVALQIPSLRVRRAETTVELPSGGAMMIAGMLQQQTKQNIDSVPGLAAAPVLGALFRSRDYLSGETELAIIVEPFVVKSTSADQLQTPVDGLQIADDLTTDLMGKLNKSSNVSPAAVAGKSLQGPYGYVIE
jgi:pilus assembly protein CpaC